MQEGLERFLKAQEIHYETALREIRAGRKRSHWMWFIFPQIAGLGRSSAAQYYAIRDLEEAKAYLEDAVLGENLLLISQALLEVDSDDAEAVMGWPDHLKLWSSMTLFALAKPDCLVFQKVLDKFYGGKKDAKTMELLNMH